MKTIKRGNDRKGSMLVLVMAVLLGLSLIGVAMLRQGSVNGIEVSREVSKAKAFWMADGGIEEARSIAYVNYQAGSSEIFPIAEPRVWSGSTSFGAYTVTVTEEGGLPGVYLIVSDAVSAGGDQRILSLGVSQEPALLAGVFGDSSLTLQPRTAIYSYNSSSNPVPTPSDSTGEVIIGSNEDIALKASVTVDGIIILGENADGVVADCSGCEGVDVMNGGRIDPDPLGIRGGVYEGFLNDAVSVNNNAAVPAIVGAVWTVANNSTSTIVAGTYYVTSIEVRGTVITDASAGVIEVFLTGPMKAWPGSIIGASGSASAFRVYSNSDAGIDLQPDGNFGGFIYAPYSDEVKLRPSNDFYGSAWGENVKILPGGDFFIDTSIMAYDAFAVFRMEFGKWRQLK